MPFNVNLQGDKIGKGGSQPSFGSKIISKASSIAQGGVWGTAARIERGNMLLSKKVAKSGKISNCDDPQSCEELRALGPIACPSWLPRHLSDTVKLTEKCSHTETLSNTGEHYQCYQ